MWRQRAVFGLFSAAFLLIVFRLFYWQIIKGPSLAEAASEQYYFKLLLPALRGEIQSQDGSPIVSNKKAYLVFAEPQKIKDTREFSKKVAEILKLDAQEIEDRLRVPNAVWAPLKNKVDEIEAAQLKSFQYPGLGFEKEGKRYYPESSMAAHIVGFVGKDVSGNDAGYFGLEGYYDQALKGKSGLLVQEKDARGLPIVLGGSKRIPAEDGQNLKLYVDRTIQFIADQYLKKGILKYGAKSGIIAIMDPKTGGLLASATYPTYDPNDYPNADMEMFANPLVSMTYEPGSTFKTIVMAAALNEKAVRPQMIFNESEPVKIGEYLIKTWNDQYHGDMTMTEVLEKSSNPGMVYVGKLLGRDKLYKYLTQFGFGTKTGIDVQGEEEASIRPIKNWYEIDAATATFGQGIAVTPIQMLRAVAALANQGRLMQPMVVKAFIDPSGKTIDQQPKKISQVITTDTASQIKEMMVAAADHGDAKWTKPKGYRIAGKTGTAQVPIAGHYDEKKTIASFVGFAPADDPKFVMLVLLSEPQTSQWGSETAAPLFFSVAKELFTYYGISPRD